MTATPCTMLEKCSGGYRRKEYLLKEDQGGLEWWQTVLHVMAGLHRGLTGYSGMLDLHLICNGSDCLATQWTWPMGSVQVNNILYADLARSEPQLVFVLHVLHCIGKSCHMHRCLHIYYNIIPNQGNTHCWGIQSLLALEHITSIHVIWQGSPLNCIHEENRTIDVCQS